MSLIILAEFSSFNEFEIQLQSYAKQNFVNYYTSGSKSSNDPQIILSYKTYKCVHAKDPESHTSKSQGLRPNQKINSKDCPWTIRCSDSKKKGVFIVKDFIDHHCKDGVATHPIGEQYYKLHPNQRKIDSPIKASIKEMINTKAKPALIRETVANKFNIKIQPKQIYNLKNNLEGIEFPVDATDTEKIHSFVDKRREIDGHNGFNFTYDIDSNNLLLLTYQNNSMKQLYAQYGELLIIDATYKINANNYSLYIFVVIDNNNKTQIVSISLAAFEVQKVFNSLLQHFQANNNLLKTTVILSDKDMVESNAFKIFFPHAAHPLCHWHVHKNFKDNFKRKQTLELAKQIIHSKTPDEYLALKEQFYKSEPSEIKHKYFNDNWDSISSKWVGFYRNILPTFNSNASSRGCQQQGEAVYP